MLLSEPKLFGCCVVGLFVFYIVIGGFTFCFVVVVCCVVVVFWGEGRGK